MVKAPCLWNPAPPPSLAIRGTAERFPVHRLYFVGRNYYAHSVEMGSPVDKSTASPFYFTKDPSTLTASGATVAYPPETHDYQHEMELVLALGAAGFRVAEQDAARLIYGYACGLDMTRRDLQRAARDKGRPWDLGKNIESGSVVSEIVPMPGTVLSSGAIRLEVNDKVRQDADLSLMIWNIPELIADLSKFYHLQPGDLLYTGTPAGVGPLAPGDHLQGTIDGVGTISLHIGPAD